MEQCVEMRGGNLLETIFDHKVKKFPDFLLLNCSLVSIINGPLKLEMCQSFMMDTVQE
jgi:hypothetical protein